MNAIKNKVQLIGHLGQTPEITNFEGGKKVANLNLATNEIYKDANGKTYGYAIGVDVLKGKF